MLVLVLQDSLHARKLYMGTFCTEALFRYDIQHIAGRMGSGTPPPFSIFIPPCNLHAFSFAGAEILGMYCIGFFPRDWKPHFSSCMYTWSDAHMKLNLWMWTSVNSTTNPTTHTYSVHVWQALEDLLAVQGLILGTRSPGAIPFAWVCATSLTPWGWSELKERRPACLEGVEGESKEAK